MELGDEMVQTMKYKKNSQTDRTQIECQFVISRSIINFLGGQAMMLSRYNTILKAVGTVCLQPPADKSDVLQQGGMGSSYSMLGKTKKTGDHSPVDEILIVNLLQSSGRMKLHLQIDILCVAVVIRTYIQMDVVETAEYLHVCLV